MWFLSSKLSHNKYFGADDVSDERHNKTLNIAV